MKREADDSELLWSACLRNDTDLVKRLIAQDHVNVNRVDLLGRTPLYMACFHGMKDIVKVLITHEHIDVNKADEDGQTPLHVASHYGHIHIVELLVIQCHANLNKVDNFGLTPFFIACIYKHKAIAEFLLAHNGDVNKENERGEPLLFTACRHGYTNTVEFLIDHGADVNKTNSRGLTPLYVACVNEYRSIIRLLIIKGHADVNKATPEICRLPLHEACSHGDADTIMLLLAYGSYISNDLLRDLFAMARGEEQFMTYFINECILPIWCVVQMGTFSPDSPLAELRNFKHIVNHVCLLNLPLIIRKRYPEKELH